VIVDSAGCTRRGGVNRLRRSFCKGWRLSVPKQCATHTRYLVKVERVIGVLQAAPQPPLGAVHFCALDRVREVELQQVIDRLLDGGATVLGAPFFGWQVVGARSERRSLFGTTSGKPSKSGFACAPSRIRPPQLQGSLREVHRGTLSRDLGAAQRGRREPNVASRSQSQCAVPVWGP
jgi:hypothetical protein